MSIFTLRGIYHSDGEIDIKTTTPPVETNSCEQVNTVSERVQSNRTHLLFQPISSQIGNKVNNLSEMGSWTNLGWNGQKVKIYNGFLLIRWV
jgi:hypothetical protein